MKAISDQYWVIWSGLF